VPTPDAQQVVISSRFALPVQLAGPAGTWKSDVLGALSRTLGKAAGVMFCAPAHGL